MSVTGSADASSFLKGIGEIPALFQAQISAALKKNADELADGYRRTAPRDTGALAATIVEQEIDNLHFEVSIGDHNTPIGPIEFGHMMHGKHVHATPFVYPTKRTLRTKQRNRLRRAVRSVWKVIPVVASSDAGDDGE